MRRKFRWLRLIVFMARVSLLRLFSSMCRSRRMNVSSQDQSVRVFWARNASVSFVLGAPDVSISRANTVICRTRLARKSGWAASEFLITDRVTVDRGISMEARVQSRMYQACSTEEMNSTPRKSQPIISVKFRSVASKRVVRTEQL